MGIQQHHSKVYDVSISRYVQFMRHTQAHNGWMKSTAISAQQDSDLDSDPTPFFFRLNKAPIEHPRKSAASFAVAVTARVAAGNGWIARHGEQRLLRSLQRILPRVCSIFECCQSLSIIVMRELILGYAQIIQPECKGHRFRLKGKISGSEFNKLLQQKFLYAREPAR